MRLYPASSDHPAQIIEEATIAASDPERDIQPGEIDDTLRMLVLVECRVCGASVGEFPELVGQDGMSECSGHSEVWTDDDSADIDAYADRMADTSDAPSDDDPCTFCGERNGDHSEEMRWTCLRGGR